MNRGQQGPRRHVTLQDVATAAGVSASTASKAMNDRFDVSAATRARVLQAAAELGFNPNPMARGLAGGRSQTIGIITKDINGRFVSQIMRGAELAIGRSDAIVLLANCDRESEREEAIVRNLLTRRVDGLIVVDPEIAPREPVRGAGSTPVVYAFGWSSDPRDHSVVPDTEAGGRAAAEHLVGLGRTEIAIITGPGTSHAAMRRAAGARAALADAGLTPVAEVSGPWTEQWGWDAADALLRVGVGFDGVVAGDDRMARGVIERVWAEGWAVPHRVAVIGQDDWWPVVHGRVPISSVSMDLEEVGAVAARLLTDPDAAPGVHFVAPRVVARATTVPGACAD